MNSIQILLTGKYPKTQARFWLCDLKVLFCSLPHMQKARASCCDLIVVKKLLRRWQHSPRSHWASFRWKANLKIPLIWGTQQTHDSERSLWQAAGMRSKWTAVSLARQGDLTVRRQDRAFSLLLCLVKALQRGWLGPVPPGALREPTLWLGLPSKKEFYCLCFWEDPSIFHHHSTAVSDMFHVGKETRAPTNRSQGKFSRSSFVLTG